MQLHVIHEFQSRRSLCSSAPAPPPVLTEHLWHMFVELCPAHAQEDGDGDGGAERAGRVGVQQTRQQRLEEGADLCRADPLAQNLPAGGRGSEEAAGGRGGVWSRLRGVSLRICRQGAGSEEARRRTGRGLVAFERGGAKRQRQAPGR